MQLFLKCTVFVSGFLFPKITSRWTTIWTLGSTREPTKPDASHLQFKFRLNIYNIFD